MHSCCYRHVVLGEYDVRRDPDCCRNCNGNKCAAKKIIRGIAEIIPYESYQANGNAQEKNDIALIRLNESVPLFQDGPKLSSAQPICLPWSKNLELTEDTNVLITGWGRTTNDAIENQKTFLQHKVSSETLQKLKIPIANEKCTEDNLFTINKRIQLCAGGKDGK